MKIELRKLKHSPSFSEETNAFTADIYVDGVKVGYARNGGHGGNTDIHAYDGMESLLDAAEEFAKTLPPVKSEFEGLGDLSMDLEFLVDNLVNDDLKAVDIKKALKKLDTIALKKWVIVSKQELENFTNGNGELKWKEMTSKTIPSLMTTVQYALTYKNVAARLNGDEIIINHP